MMSATSLIFMEYVQSVISVIAVVYLTLLTIWHAKNVKYEIGKGDGLLDCKFQSLVTYSFVLLIIGLFYAIFGIYNAIEILIFFPYGIEHCYAQLYILSGLYGLFKITMYLALFVRFQTTFKESAMECPKIVHTIYPITVTILMLILEMLLIFTTKTKIVDDICKYEISELILLCAVLTDFMVCGINLYIFLKPLFKLSSMHANDNYLFNFVIRKNAVLASVSMISTIIAYILLIIMHGNWTITWQALDIIVTNTCIVCLFRFNQPLFNVFCGCIKLSEEDANVNATNE